MLHRLKKNNNLDYKIRKGCAAWYSDKLLSSPQDTKKTQEHLDINLYYDKSLTDIEFGYYRINNRKVNSLLERKFIELADKWEESTGIYSTITPKIVNDYFYDLLLLGKDIIPLILNYIKNGGTAQWHIVLKAITKENPVPDEFITKSKKIKEYWINWGIENKYI